MNIKHTLAPTLLAGLFAVSAPFQSALAAHADIEIEDVSGGQIFLHTDAQPIDFATGNAIFEAELGESALTPHETDDPGINTGAATPFATAGNSLMYQTLGTLSFWDGSSWGAADANTSVHVLGNFFEDSIYSSAGLSGNAFGLIQQIGADGDIHSHVSFCVEDQGLSGCPANPTEITANDPTSGAYLIELSMFETDSYDGSSIGNIVSESDPFFIAFNNGLDDVAFEAGIDALSVSAVPVPAAVWLFASGILGLVSVARRNA